MSEKTATQESQKLEQSSAPIPDDLKDEYEFALRHPNAQTVYLKEKAELIERIASLTAQVATLESDAQQCKRKLAVLFDESTYSDSYGVEGSSFSVCRWCGGGSGPGGSAPFKHNAGCLFDDDALEAKVREVWDEDTAFECLSLEKRIATLESEKAAAHEAGFAEAREAAARIADCSSIYAARAIRLRSAPTKEQQGGER